jgi:adenosine deaminase/adenosine deaminase CECR1
MKDYWLQMVMFKYCHSLYPTVKYSMHAGELTLGLVPEDLTWHIELLFILQEHTEWAWCGSCLPMRKSIELLALYGKKIVLHRN